MKCSIMFHKKIPFSCIILDLFVLLILFSTIKCLELNNQDSFISIINNRRRFKFDLLQFHKLKKIGTTTTTTTTTTAITAAASKIEISVVTKKPEYKVFQNSKIQFQNYKPNKFSKYVWNELGQFWTYRNNFNIYRNPYPNQYFPYYPNPPPCLSPYCFPTRCQPRYSCISGECRYQRCGNYQQECSYGEKKVKFGSRMVCVRESTDISCDKDCSENGICVSKQCYCKNGFIGDNCLIMKAEFCKRKYKIYCSFGCSKNGKVSAQTKCVCSENERAEDCIEMRKCKFDCNNQGICVKGKCKCHEQYTGAFCDQKVTACSFGKVGNLTCTQICASKNSVEFQCKCKSGFVLDTDGKSCLKKKCSNSTSISTINGKCICKIGWEGEYCDQDINECKTDNNCQQLCVNTIGSYKCKCTSGFKLYDSRFCIKECPRNCSLHGDCLNGVCMCYRGWSGLYCSQDIDECQYNHKCDYGCINTVGSYKCICPNTMVLSDDQKSCKPLPCNGGCLNDGKCDNDICRCVEPFYGTQCELTDYCKLLKPCSQICRLTNDRYVCDCEPGYELIGDAVTCRKRCNCVHGRCDSNGRCICNSGYRGENCSVDIDECEEGSHKCAQFCINGIGSYKCSCTLGYKLTGPEMRDCKRVTKCPNCIRGTCATDKCLCPTGYEGVQCEHDVNECERKENNCDHICINTPGSFVCQCQPGFQLSNDGKSCIRNNENKINCAGKLNCTRGECINGQCVCPMGYRGRWCEFDIDECSYQIKVCGQICTNTVGSFKCSCQTGYVLADDNRLCIPQCSDCGSGVCRGGRCICPAGLTGDRCQNDIDECRQSDSGGCQHICTNTFGSYKCSCYSGGNYFLQPDGKSCITVQQKRIDECLRRGCINGQCNSDTGNCDCKRGFKGSKCETDVNECTIKGEGDTGNDCEQICINTVGSFRCSCRSGYNLKSDGRRCERKKGNCKTNCVRGYCGNEDNCVCFKGYMGDSCDKDLDECTMWKGICEHICINTIGSYKCSCRDGYMLDNDDKHSCRSLCHYCKNGVCISDDSNNRQNRRCKCKSGWEGYSCDKDVDECIRNVHKCDHFCHNRNGSYDCSCRTGFKLSTEDGRTCISDLITDNECKPSCRNGGKCVTGKCQCRPGFTGPLCADDIDECQWPRSRHGCMDGCRNTYGNYECFCPPGYLLTDDQKTCQLSTKDTMCNPACRNGGVCRGGVRCYCSLGFQGIDCGQDINECTRYEPCDPKYGECINTFGSYYCRCRGDRPILMYDGTTCMTRQEAITKPHLRYRGRGTKGITLPNEN